MNIKMSEKSIKIAILLGFVAVFIIFILAGGQEYLNLDKLLENRQALLDYTEQNYALVFSAAFVIYVISTTFSLPGATVLSLALGFLFGRWVVSSEPGTVTFTAPPAASVKLT